MSNIETLVIEMLVQYLRAEADFNRSWTDGRRGADRIPSEEYNARRIELAVERERWADVVEKLARERDLLRAALREAINLGRDERWTSRAREMRDGQLAIFDKLEELLR